MGGTWRMPSRYECEELYTNCNVVPITIDGVEGYQYISKINGASIFIPCVGYYSEEEKAESSSGCDSPISSSTLIMTSSPSASYPDLCSTVTPLGGGWQSGRYCGYQVRAVSD